MRMPSWVPSSGRTLVVPRLAAADVAGFPFARGLRAGSNGGELQIGLPGLRRDELLGLEHEAAPAIEVNAALGVSAGAGGDPDGKLEGVAGGMIVAGARHAEEIGQLGEEKLGIGALAGGGAGPMVGKSGSGGRAGRHHRGGCAGSRRRVERGRGGGRPRRR